MVLLNVTLTRAPVALGLGQDKTQVVMGLARVALAETLRVG